MKHLQTLHGMPLLPPPPQEKQKKAKPGHAASIGTRLQGETTSGIGSEVLHSEEALAGGGQIGITEVWGLMRVWARGREQCTSSVIIYAQGLRALSLLKCGLCQGFPLPSWSQESVGYRKKWVLQVSDVEDFSFRHKTPILFVKICFYHLTPPPPPIFTLLLQDFSRASPLPFHCLT